MTTFRSLSFKTLVSSALTFALLSTTVGCTVVGPGYDNKPVYRTNDNRNRNFNSISQQLRQDLRRKGYQVMDIRPDNYRGNQTVLVYAKKNNQAYEFIYSYPELKLISSSKQNWRDDDYKKDKKYHKNKKYKNKGKYKN